jgi:hypothetical protein
MRLLMAKPSQRLVIYLPNSKFFMALSGLTLDEEVLKMRQHEWNHVVAVMTSNRILDRDCG